MDGIKQAIAGKFNKLDDGEKEFVMQAVAHFHVRDGVVQPDGSIGTIVITSKQLNDLLAYMRGAL